MIAWLALTLAVLELLLLAGVVVLVGRFWRQVAPQITPLLAMFTPPREPRQCEYLGVEGDRCAHPAGHSGPHEWNVRP